MLEDEQSTARPLPLAPPPPAPPPPSSPPSAGQLSRTASFAARVCCIANILFTTELNRRLVGEAGIRGRYYVPVAGEAPFDAHVLNETLAAALWEMSEDIVAPWAGGGGKGRGSP